MLKSGFAKGKEEKCLEIAKKMKQENVDFELIVKVTGLSKEQIENL